MKLLLVEDSQRLRRTLTLGLKNAGYAVDASGDGLEGAWWAENNAYDAIILDIMLPGLDGLSLLQRLRAHGNKTHVLILTARDTVNDRVLGLQQGADDYLVKPFAFKELLARIEALCRRSYGRKSSTVKLGALELELGAKKALVEGQSLELNPREYALLEFLALRHGEVVGRDEIESHIYDDLTDPMSNVVDSAICILRKKLGQAEGTPVIRTRRGLGYLLEVA